MAKKPKSLPPSGEPGKETVKIRRGKMLHTVRLGRKPPRPDKKILRLSYFVDPEQFKAFTPPASYDERQKAWDSLDRMYANDRYGDCVVAEKFHKIGFNSAADGKPCRVGEDSEVINQYHRICGPGDNGCVITDVLDEMVAGRFTVGGKPAKLDGYVSVDNRADLAKAAVWMLGQITLGVDLPSAWSGSNKIWDVTSSRIVGGHDVGIFGWNDKGFLVSTWGDVVTMTYAAFEASKWVGEVYACLGPDWYNDDQLGPNMGLDVPFMKKCLELLKQGKIPEIPPAALLDFRDLV